MYRTTADDNHVACAEPLRYIPAEMPTISGRRSNRAKSTRRKRSGNCINKADVPRN
ncbi:MAG: hypothetical protein FWE00_11740 [Defluviitaleaceae bacterium]|nr:hypothetical protein [Defluviitaleaceae bacterium]